MKKEKNEDLLRFQSLRDALIFDGFRELTPSVLKKIYRSLGLKPPKVERTKDVEDRVSFIIEINGYAIYVHTTFNRMTEKFSPYGRVYIIIAKIVDYSSVRLLSRSFYRSANGSFVHKVQQYVNFFIRELSENRPLTAKRNWAELKEKGQDKFFWVDENNKNISLFFKDTFGYPIVRKIENQKRYYNDVVRKENGIKRRHRKIRRKYMKTK